MVDLEEIRAVSLEMAMFVEQQLAAVVVEVLDRLVLDTRVVTEHTFQTGRLQLVQACLAGMREVVVEVGGPPLVDSVEVAEPEAEDLEDLL
tara:strand:- start:258 stop:530 length:273 start_codon:yes stop_codon:yes gene_type:complete